MEKKIAVCFGTDEEKNARARLSLLIVEGDMVISRQYHNIPLLPGADLAVERARVEAHIGLPQAQNSIPGAPWPKIPDAEWAEVEQHIAIVHKPAVVQAYKDRLKEK